MTSRIAVWAAVFAVCTVAQRIILLLMGSSFKLGPMGVASILLSLPQAFVLGALLACLVFAGQSPLYRIWVAGLVVVVLFLHSAAWNYEAVFDRLPTAGVFFYLNDFKELMPSILGNTSLVNVGWTAMVFALLVVTRRWLVAREFGKQRQKRSLLAIVLMTATSLGLFLAPSLADDSFPWRHHTPLVWLAMTSLDTKELNLPDQEIGPQSVLWFQEALGHRPPFAAAIESAPLCGPGLRSPGRTGSDPPRSAILLILESVGYRELMGDYQEQAIMPELRSFGERHLLFNQIKAAGTKSGSAMPAVFCGLPPQTEEHLLHQLPLNNMQGFATILAEHGYRRSYHHGADLSWEYQRSFLRMVGFDEIHERDPLSATPVYGWGYSDCEMLGRLRAWIESCRTETPNTPFLTTLFTLSSHDPYELPADWDRRFEIVDARSRQYESLAFLDHYLGEFLHWYEEVELPRGTVLIIVGDHTPHLLNTTRSEVGPRFRFDVPLIVAGNAAPIASADRAWQSRLGAQYDIPATLMHALGWPVPACDQGLSLLRDPDSWPDDRIVYTVGGEDLNECQIFSPHEHLLLDRQSRGIHALIGHDISPRMQRFVRTLYPLNAYLIQKNAYAPRMIIDASREALPRVHDPIFISHRGNTGLDRESAHENTSDAIASAFDSGFQWVEIDVQFTRDEIAVVAHDPVYDTADGRRRYSDHDLAEIREDSSTRVETLESVLEKFPGNFVIELKPQQDYDHQVAFAESVATIARHHRGDRQLILDSFSLVQAGMAKGVSGCDVAWDLPFRRPVSREYLNSALLAGMDWIFVEYSVLTPGVIATAHQAGLRVCAYTINDHADLLRLAPELPDAVITDRVDLERAAH